MVQFFYRNHGKNNISTVIAENNWFIYLYQSYTAVAVNRGYG